MKKIVATILCLMLCLGAVSAFAANQYITIGTAGTAGSLYPMGVAMAQTITDHVEGMTATGEATAASIQNLRDMHEGESEMGISQCEVAYYAYNGQMDYEGNAYPDIRALYSTIYNYLQVFVAADSDIQSIPDLKGKTVSMGSAGSGGEMNARALLGAYGLDYSTVNAQFMGESDGASALKDGKIDAMIATHPLGSAALTELTTSMNARMVEIPADSEFFAIYPLFAPITVPVGTYNNQDTDIVTPRASVIMCTSTNSGLTDDEVYEIVKAVWENRDEWAGVSKSVETQVTLDSVLEGIAIPMHPGAIRYFEEIGVEIPENLK